MINWMINYMKGPCIITGYPTYYTAAFVAVVITLTLIIVI